MTYQYPFKDKYRIGTRYGKKGKLWACGWHSGLDLFSKRAGGDGKIYPIADGMVIANGTSKSYGNYITIQHAEGYLSLYAHMAKRSTIPIGATVHRPAVIGIEGSTGNSTAPHLHLEIHKGSYKYPSSIDPEKFLKERMMTIQEAIEQLAKVGLIDSPVYWMARYRDLPYLDKLFISLAVNVKKQQSEVATLPDALDRLVSAGVIQSPKYWQENAGKVHHLDKLIIKAAEYI